MAEGLFGSNVGGKASQRPKPFISAPARPIVLPKPHMAQPPSIHVSPLHPSKASLGLSSSSSTAMFHGTHTYGATGGPAGAPTGGQTAGGLLGDIAGGLEGFIGHLGSDVVHMAAGLPVGIAYLATHPIAGAEGIVATTWQDWSPLVRANLALIQGDTGEAAREYETWGSHFYAHPLGPILDLVGFATFGAGTAARGAGAIGKLGEVAATAEAADAAAATVAKGASVAEAGRTVGEASLQTSTFLGKALKAGNPAKFADAVYASTAEKLGYVAGTEEHALFVQAAKDANPLFTRYISKGGVKVYRMADRNPLVRARQDFVSKTANDLAAKSPRLAKVIGDDAMFKRWTKLDVGGRRAALAKLIQSQIALFHKTGEIFSHTPAHELGALMEAPMRDGLVAHSHIVEAGPDLAAQIKQLAQDGYQPLRSDQARAADIAKALTDLEAKGHAGIEDYLREAWPKANVTDKPEELLRDANGNLRVVSRPEAQSVGTEAAMSSRVAKLIYTDPTKVWRFALLGLSPRYFVNNFVGNGLMLLAATDPMSFGKAMIDHIRTVRGSKAAFQAELDGLHAQLHGAQAILAAPIKAGGRGLPSPASMAIRRLTAARNVTSIEEAIKRLHVTREIHGLHWTEKWFGAEYGFGNANRIDAKTGLAEGGILQRLPNLHRVTHNKADMPYRFMAMQYTMRRIPEFQREFARLKAAGHSTVEAERRAAELAASNPMVRQIIRTQVNHMLGQYHTYTKMERGIRQIVPFYAWDRAIAAHVRELFLNQPYKLAMGAAIGSVGNRKTAEILGQVPDFMLGAIPAKLLSGPWSPLNALLGQNGSRVNVFNTQGLNPYATIGDLSASGLAALGIGNARPGESLGAQLNPVIQAAAQQIGGVDLQTGSPVQPGTGGPLVGTYMSMFGSLPQMNLLKALVGIEGSSVTSKGNPTLYAKNTQAPFSSFLGLPVRQVDLGTAASLAAKQQGIKKPKKTTKLHIVGL